MRRAEWLVVVGVCTHLGCTPAASTPQVPEGQYGGWLCPCHGSQYDTAGRVRVGPAPRKSDVPPYQFLSDTRIQDRLRADMSGPSTYVPKTGLTRWLDARLPIVRFAHDMSSPSRRRAT